jgi:hypothetical protein
MRRLKMLMLLLLSLVILIFSWTAFANWVLPARLFRQAVLNPIPPSIKNIRGIAFCSLGCEKYILRFDISEPDVQLIVASDQFREIGFVGYRDNMLDVGKVHDPGVLLNLFEGWRETYPPRWFKFADWKAFKAYVVEREDIDFFKVRLLVYSQDLGEAYFVHYEARGH